MVLSVQSRLVSTKARPGHGASSTGERPTFGKGSRPSGFEIVAADDVAVLVEMVLESGVDRTPWGDRDASGPSGPFCGSPVRGLRDQGFQQLAITTSRSCGRCRSRVQPASPPRTGSRSGCFTYSSTARRITLGELSNQRNGLFNPASYRSPPLSVILSDSTIQHDQAKCGVLYTINLVYVLWRAGLYSGETFDKPYNRGGRQTCRGFYHYSL